MGTIWPTFHADGKTPVQIDKLNIVASGSATTEIDSFKSCKEILSTELVAGDDSAFTANLTSLDDTW
jgi:hypothetical protein